MWQRRSESAIERQSNFFSIISILILLFALIVNTGLAHGGKNEAERLWELGEKAYNEGKYKEAIVYYEKSLSLCRNDNECIAANLNGIGTCHEALGDDMKALPYYERALDSARKAGNEDILATAFFNVGAVYYRQAIDYEKAFNYLDESARLFRDLNDKNSLGIVLHYLGKVSLLLGRYGNALDSFNESIKIAKEKNDTQAIGSNLANIGRVYYRKGEYEKAIPIYEEALISLRQAKDLVGVSVLLRDLADAHSGLYKNDKALSYYEEAIAIQKKNNFTGELGITYNNLGAFYGDLNQHEKALTNYKKALEIAKGQNNKPTIATLFNNIGHVYAKLGNSDKAIKFYKESLELERQLKRPLSLTYVLNNIGMEYFRLGKYDDALKYLKNAIEIDRKLNNPHLLETRLNNIGAVYLKHGRLKDAEDIFLERKKLEPMIKPNRLLHPGLIEVYLLTGRYDEALRLANAIPPSWKDNHERHIEYYNQVGLALKGKKAFQESAINLMNAINIVEDMRQSTTEKSQFFTGGGYYGRLTPYRAIISVLYEMSEKGYNFTPGSKITFTPEAASSQVRIRRSAFNFLSFGQNPASAAFYFSELTKARILLEAMTGSLRKTITEEISKDLRNAEDRLLQDIAFIDSRWEEALKRGEQAVKELQQKREGVKKQLDDLIEVLRKNYPRYAALHYPLPVKAEELPLRTDEVLFEYAVTDDATYLFVIRKGGVKRLIKIPLTKESLEETVKLFIEPMNTRNQSRFSVSLAKKLYETLLLGALKEIKENERIIIVPDGILGLLPFEALIIKEGTEIKDSLYVADKYTITYYQSATIMALQRILKETQPEKPLFAIGNPVYSKDDPRYIAWKQGGKEQVANLKQYAFRGLSIKAKWGAVTEEEPDKIEFSPLPETEDEIREIAKIMGVKPEPPQVLLSVMANERNLKNAGLKNYRYIHFATHASLPGMIQGINEPFILLGQVENQGDDSFLTLSEVAGMKLNADMVVLSACVTGVGREVEGEGVVNFARAFQQAGAKSVVVSLWEVASEPAVEYMKTFYSYLKSGKSMSEAIKLTRQQMKAKYPNPFYWAVFILHGEG